MTSVFYFIFFKKKYAGYSHSFFKTTDLSTLFLLRHHHYQSHPPGPQCPAEAEGSGILFCLAVSAAIGGPFQALATVGVFSMQVLLKVLTDTSASWWWDGMGERNWIQFIPPS